ncbi:SAM-dependent methyltransferase, partial [Acetobacteraceae bacterium]|nr:SAM-dependent methyltransferase [Candidatus Parcubacteria bacterium]
GPHQTSSRVQEMQTKEAFLNDLATYQELAQRIATGKEKLQTLLSSYRAEGKRIVGYGAPAKATTLCYGYGIDGSTLEYIVDDSIIKQGRYMPGTHIPIKPSSALYDDKPEVCLILAWNFADSIVKNHEQFVKNGGIFISPVPEPRIIA